MRSGNGRHRRPRQAPAFFVAAGVTGAGLAMPLLSAGGAEAVDGSVWDRVAECESGGLWSANSGNGYYGGLQFTLQTWEEYGGTELAERPDLASRGQQIDIAEKILAEEGPQAWPSCSISAGLLPDEPEESPDVPDAELPDVPETELPEPPGASEPPTGSPSDAPREPSEGGSPEGRPGEDADGSSKQPTEQPSDRPSDGGASRGPSDDAPGDDEASPGAPGGGDTAERGEPSGDGGADGTGRHRGEPGDEHRRDAEKPSRGKHKKPGRSAEEHLVRTGDSLSAIAARHELPGGWPELYERNREVVGDDPDLIFPGQLLDLRTGGELR